MTDPYVSVVVQAILRAEHFTVQCIQRRFCGPIRPQPVVAANGIVYGCFGPEREPAEKSDTLLFFIGAALGEMF